MKAVALESVINHQPSTFRNFIEKLVGRFRGKGQTMLGSEDFFTEVKFFEDDLEMDAYCRTFRE